MNTILLASMTLLGMLTLGLLAAAILVNPLFMVPAGAVFIVLFFLGFSFAPQG